MGIYNQKNENTEILKYFYDLTQQKEINHILHKKYFMSSPFLTVFIWSMAREI